MTADPLPVSGAQLRAWPLRVLARPAPGREAAVVGEWVDALPTSRVLAARWALSGIVRCPTCSAPVRYATWDVLGALLGDIEPTPADEDCIWCGPAGVRRWFAEVWAR